MSREIKFRAWDRRMENWLTFTLGQAMSGQVDYELRFNSITPENTTQYTGLKDKNGVEIYEGDVLSYEGFTGVVEYDAPEFIVNDMIWTMTECEVIGNIYENKELLEDDDE